MIRSYELEIKLGLTLILVHRTGLDLVLQEVNSCCVMSVLHTRWVHLTQLSKQEITSYDLYARLS